MTEPLCYRLQVEVLEDLHAGSGTGGGDVDAFIARDRRGFPTLRASHFKGLLREVGEELDKNGSARLDALLGKAGGSRGALRMTSLRVSQGGKTTVWTSTAREEGDRRPKEDTMRVVEHVAAGTVFTADMRLADSTLQDYLKSLVVRVDRIGGSRTRGSGLITSKLDLVDRSPDTRDKVVGQPDDDNTRLRLVLRNLDPVCLPATGHPGNLIRSQSFIRGQALKGALMAWAVAAGKRCDILKCTSVGDALPLPDTVEAADWVLPIPLSLQTEKPRGGDALLPWWAGGAGSQPAAYDSLVNAYKPDEKPKRPGSHEYLCRNGEQKKWLRYAPTISVRMRNESADAQSPETQLFSMEEIAEDTRFQADLIFDDTESAKDFHKQFSTILSGADWLAIGRGGQPMVVEQARFQSNKVEPCTDGGGLTLTLTSDLIVRGPTLGFFDNLDESVLFDLIGIKCAVNCKIEKSFVDTEHIQGFNAASGLRRASAIAIRRGSCWHIKADACQALAQALAKKPALGERTREGFGRFVLNCHPFEVTKPESASRQPDPRPQEALRKTALRLKGKATSIPSSSQLQWLRQYALAATEGKVIDDLLLVISTLQKTNDAEHRNRHRHWSGFPAEELINELAKLPELDDKKFLISCLVQWLLLKPKTGAGEVQK